MSVEFTYRKLRVPWLHVISILYCTYRNYNVQYKDRDVSKVKRYVQYRVLLRRITKVKPVKIAIETATKNDHLIWYDSVS